MNYEMEELLPVVKKLTDKYTSKESTSVSYEVAKQLMEAILYCIHEFDSISGNLPAGDKPDGETAYQEGSRIVFEKVEHAKRIYHRMLRNFSDYGCRNYRDTIVDGMPAFFINYDYRFNPQDHVLTLDYPVIRDLSSKTGVDLILEYLEDIEYEQIFLRFFHQESIVHLLELERPDYRELYLNNICQPILLRAVECLIADENLANLKLDEKQFEELRAEFKKMPLEQLENKLAGALKIIEKGVMKGKNKNKFQICAREFAVRILV